MSESEFLAQVVGEVISEIDVEKDAEGSLVIRSIRLGNGVEMILNGSGQIGVDAVFVEVGE